MRRFPRSMPIVCTFCVVALLLVANATVPSHSDEKVRHHRNVDTSTVEAEPYTARHHRNVDASTVEAEPYTADVVLRKEDHTNTYGDISALRQSRALLDAKTYHDFVQNMPIVCVDVALTRSSDGHVLLVRRHSEPVKGLYWWVGGRLLLGESFAEAAVRKVSKELGVDATACAEPLGTWNTLFEMSAWGGATHTVNILMHAVTHDPLARTGLNICGDQAGRCAATGEHGYYRWLSPATSEGEAPYVLDGFAALRARNGRCTPVALLAAHPHGQHHAHGHANATHHPS